MLCSALAPGYYRGFKKVSVGSPYFPLKPLAQSKMHTTILQTEAHTEKYFYWGPPSLCFLFGL